MRRITLQPVRRFAFLAVLAHVLLGGLIWWWLTRTSSADKQAGGKDSLTWVSPADFDPSKSPAPTAAQVPVSPPPPEPKPEPPAPAKPKTAEDPAIKSMLAVAAAPPLPPSQPSRPPLPKAIAIDPAQAKALMEAQEKAGAPPPSTEKPKEPAAPPPPPAKSEPSPVPAPPAPHAEAPAPISDVSRFITVSSRSVADKSQRLEEVDRAVRDAFMRQWMPPRTETLNINQRTAHMDMTVDRAGHVLNFTLVKRSGSESFDLSLREAAHKLNSIPVTLPASYPQDHYDFQLHFHVE